jgi:hypothetical protein
MFSQFLTSANASTFMESLCAQNVLEECRFALALTNSGTGEQVIGTVDTSMFEGSMTVAPIITGWALKGDLTIDGVIFEKEILVELDSGTATVVG